MNEYPYCGSLSSFHNSTQHGNFCRQKALLIVILLQVPHEFKVYKSVHYGTIQVNHQPDATIFQFIILTFIYSSTCFGRFPAHHQEHNDRSGSLWFYLRIVVIVALCSWSGRPRTQHDYHHNTKVKPEVATAVVELLIMGKKRPKHVEL
jgi:hypothetical protein